MRAASPQVSLAPLSGAPPIHGKDVQAAAQADAWEPSAGRLVAAQVCRSGGSMGASIVDAFAVIRSLPRAVAADEFVVNNFVWKDPDGCPVSELRAHYARRVGQPSTFAGYIEADALGHALNLRVGLWDVSPDGKVYRRLAWLGSGEQNAAAVHLLSLRKGHWRALLAPQHSGGTWTELETGGGGNCLFNAFGATLCRPPAESGWSAHELRMLCSTHIGKTPAYNERILAAASQAKWEWSQSSGLRRLWRRFR